MMPSRGWQSATRNAARAYQLQCRNLSSLPSRIPSSRPLSNRLRGHLPRAQWQKTTPALPSVMLSARHASTASQSQPPPTATSVTPADSTASAALPPVEQKSFPNLDTISLEGIDLNAVPDIPEGIGYLHDIGINYGYGFTSILQWTVEHLHVWGGLPWWGSIATTAVLVRVVLFPLYLKASDNMARSTAMMPITQPIKDRMDAARAAKDPMAMQAAYAEFIEVRRKAGLSFAGQFTPMIAQGVLAFCGFRLVRAMATVPVPALQYEGPLWLHDLTLSDPYLILPGIMAASMHMLVRMGGETGAATNQLPPGFQKFMLYGMPLLILGAMGFQSGALCIWFAAGGSLAIGQTLLLKQPAVRNFFGITPLYTPTPKPEPPKPSLVSSMMPKLSSSRPEPAIVDVGKNAQYMAPSYQAPSIRVKPQETKFSSTVINVKPVRPPPVPQTPGLDSEDAQRSPAGQGVAAQASTAWNQTHVRHTSQDSPATASKAQRASSTKKTKTSAKSSQNRGKGR